MPLAHTRGSDASGERGRDSAHAQASGRRRRLGSVGSEPRRIRRDPRGVVSLSFSPLGYRVERSVTTYLEDDNPIFSEVSANESVNASIRGLRSQLDALIGTANRSLTANRVSVARTSSAQSTGTRRHDQSVPRCGRTRSRRYVDRRLHSSSDRAPQFHTPRRHRRALLRK